MTLRGSIVRLAEILATIEGVKQAPSEPPESINQFPFGVVYPRSGSFLGGSAGWGDGLHVVYCEIHVSRQILKGALLYSEEIGEDFAFKVWNDPTLDGNCSTVGDIAYTFGGLEWGGIETVGFRYEVSLKIPGQAST